MLPTSIKTVHRVQNFKRLLIDFFEKIILKTLLFFKFEYSRRIRDFVNTAGLMRKYSLV